MLFLPVTLFWALNPVGRRFFPLFAFLKRDRRAVTALEYAILAATLGLVIMAVFSDFGEKLSMLFSPIDDSIPRPPSIPPP
jgi:Flp pilus assembly pilin Flp